MSRVDFEYMSSRLRLDEDTGKLYWKTVMPFSNKCIGDEAGCTSSRGYSSIFINGKAIKAHKIVWLLTYGRWPDNNIDHIDGDTRNNKPTNLRDVCQSHNSRNRSLSTNNTSGHTGVIYHKQTGKWQAEIKVKGKKMYLGLFDTIEEALVPRLAAEIKYGFINRRTTC